jgi:hypothetical protein
MDQGDFLRTSSQELSHSKRSDGRAFHEATLQSRDLVSTIHHPSFVHFSSIARMTSDQSKGRESVMWLGGVLDLPLELKRLALRDRYLMPISHPRDLVTNLSHT